jgi:hypothetical protein
LASARLLSFTRAAIFDCCPNSSNRFVLSAERLRRYDLLDT